MILYVIKLKNKNNYLKYLDVTIKYMLLFLLTSQYICAQNIKSSSKTDKIEINGILDEESWQNAEGLKDFYQFEPENGSPSKMDTEVKVVYDKEMIYFGFICYDPDPSKITSKITKRDGNIIQDDAIGIMLDTFNDKNNGYIFLINPLGTQQEGKIADNGRTEDYTWDETWYSAAKIFQKGWSVEIGIPFKSLKFNTNDTSWGVNFGRRIARLNESSFTSKKLTNIMRVSQFGKLNSLKLDNLNRKTYLVIPYFQTEFIDGDKPKRNAGLDLRFNPVSNFGIDFTLNPDFATIEADVEKVNLSRFEMSYAEKRPFFLEGSENYSTRVKQFYSRRIGEIPWGMKINGKVGKWKINGLTTQSDPSTAGANVKAGDKALYSVFRINREFKRGSTLGLIGVNRNYDSINSGSVGLVATLFASDVLGMTSQIIHSHGTANKSVWTGFVRPAYDSKFSHFHIRLSHFGKGIKENMNKTGFIRHDDRNEFDTNISRTFWINSKFLEAIETDVNYNQYWSLAHQLRSYEGQYSVEFQFLKKWEYEISYINDYKAEYLPYFEKDFYNNVLTNVITYDSKNRIKFDAEYAFGKNFDRNIEQISGGVELKIIEGWNAEYSIEKYWLDPAEPEDNNLIHIFRSSYYVNKDLYFKAFYQTKNSYFGEWYNPEFEMLRKSVQFVFVWRFLPPFGSIQIAYQEGTSKHTDIEGKARTLFTKLSWVF